jgi:hypothetical protein
VLVFPASPHPLPAPCSSCSCSSSCRAVGSSQCPTPPTPAHLLVRRQAPEAPAWPACRRALWQPRACHRGQPDGGGAGRPVQRNHLQPGFAGRVHPGGQAGHQADGRDAAGAGRGAAGERHRRLPLAGPRAVQAAARAAVAGAASGLARHRGSSPSSP